MGGDDIVDLAIIGGGVNGCGIARDAAGRGLSVFLCEQGDLAAGTSSASTKLFHGGLRYLEYFEFRLVKEALVERETLLTAMPHISWPMRFVLPHHKGLRPAWLLRLALFIYDHLGGRKLLPPTRTLDLRRDEAGASLKPEFAKAFEYSDCWVQDARLVTLNARDAAGKGAEIAVRSPCIAAARRRGAWHVTVRDADTGQSRTVVASALVNAGGPWVDHVINGVVRLNASDSVRLVRGSHIVVKKLFEHDRAYIFQQPDKRVIFAIPYEDAFTLIGTTDQDHHGSPGDAECSAEEAAYLCDCVNAYFEKQISVDDIVWTFSGVRPLYDDGAKSATAATRDYVLSLDFGNGDPPLLNVFGGKITTYRRLAEAALEKLRPFFPQMGDAWTAGASLPGGEFPTDGAGALAAELTSRHSFIDDAWARRLVRCYGADARTILGDAQTRDDLGVHFGGDLTEAEVRWLTENEWARTAEDILWRRTKLGLRLTAEEVKGLERWLAASGGAAALASGGHA